MKSIHTHRNILFVLCITCIISSVQIVYGQGRSFGARSFIIDDNAGKTISLTTGSLATNYTLLFPPSLPSAPGILTVDGSGTLRWLDLSSFQVNTTNLVHGSGPANRIAIWNSDNTLGSDSNDFYYDPLANRLGIGTTDPQNNLHIIGGIRISSLASASTALIVSDLNGDLHSTTSLPSGITVSASQLTSGTIPSGTVVTVGDGTHIITQGSGDIQGTITPSELRGAGTNNFSGSQPIAQWTSFVFIPYAKIGANSAVIVSITDPDAATFSVTATVSGISPGSGFRVEFSAPYPNPVGKLHYVIINQ